MSRRLALVAPAMPTLGAIHSTLRTWAPQLNEFVLWLSEQPQGQADPGATPSIRSGVFHEITNTSAQTITDFDDGREGQNLVVKIDANTTIAHDATKISTKTETDITGPEVVSFYLSGGVWYEEGR